MSHARQETVSAKVANFAFRQGKTFFLAPDKKLTDVLACWKQALPLHAAGIKKFLSYQEEKFFKDFLGENNLAHFKILSDKVTPWSEEDLTLYYKHCTTSEKLKSIHEERRALIKSHHPCTELDDYQWQRDLDYPEKQAERCHYKKKIGTSASIKSVFCFVT